MTRVKNTCRGKLLDEFEELGGANVGFCNEGSRKSLNGFKLKNGMIRFTFKINKDMLDTIISFNLSNLIFSTTL